MFQLPGETSSVEGQRKVKVYQMEQILELTSSLRAFRWAEGGTCWMAGKMNRREGTERKKMHVGEG